MAELTQSPLSGAMSPHAPHNTPEKSEDPPPPSHPLPPPAATAAHAARREPVRPVDGTSGWYAWTGEDLPRGGGDGGGRGRDRVVRNTRDVASERNTRDVASERDTRDVAGERNTRDQVQTPRRGQGLRRWFSGFTGADFTHPSLAGARQPSKDNLQDGSARTVTQPEASHPDSTDSSRVITKIMRREQSAAVVRRAAAAARVAAMVFCLVAFSVLAADRNKGWALDSYNEYSQLRYCETVNVIGFLYSGFQFYALMHHKRREKHIIRRPLGDYFDFIMDQVLAYLLISASSSATARVRDWVVNWGSDPFPNMASGSIAVSFLAFLAFALSSLLSAYNLFTKTF